MTVRALSSLTPFAMAQLAQAASRKDAAARRLAHETLVALAPLRRLAELPSKTMLGIVLGASGIGLLGTLTLLAGSAQLVVSSVYGLFAATLVAGHQVIAHRVHEAVSLSMQALQLPISSAT